MKRMKDGSLFSIVPCVWIINNIHHFFYCKNNKKPKYLKRYLINVMNMNVSTMIINRYITSIHFCIDEKQ